MASERSASAFRQPFDASTIEGVLYAKNRIDAVQWHLEDIIRDPAIDPVAALELKRRIDRSNACEVHGCLYNMGGCFFEIYCKDNFFSARRQSSSPSEE